MIIIPITRRITALMLLKRMAARADFRTNGSDLRGGSNKTRDASGSVIEGERKKDSSSRPSENKIVKSVESSESAPIIHRSGLAL